VIRTPYRSPKANAYAERWVGTVRRECLDWLLIRGANYLEQVLAELAMHYNAARPHRGLQLRTPIPMAVSPRHSEKSSVTIGLAGSFTNTPARLRGWVDRISVPHRQPQAQRKDRRAGPTRARPRRTG
jgi:hypothetical protein